jgi:hypothetical protein
MKRIAFAALVLAGCATAPSPPVRVIPDRVVSGPGAEPRGQLGSPFADPRTGFSTIAFPLVIDRSDLGLGTTVQFNRIPTVAELRDLAFVGSFRTLVLALPAWPAGYAAIEPLQQLPGEGETWVVLPGYPPSREAAQAWNELAVRLRMVVVVTEPPPSSAVVADLNTIRALDRLIAQTDDPRRTGFERFQRPLGFRVLRE